MGKKKKALGSRGDHSGENGGNHCEGWYWSFTSIAWVTRKELDRKGLRKESTGRLRKLHIVTEKPWTSALLSSGSVSGRD